MTVGNGGHRGLRTCERLKRGKSVGWGAGGRSQNSVYAPGEKQGGRSLGLVKGKKKMVKIDANLLPKKKRKKVVFHSSTFR